MRLVPLTVGRDLLVSWELQKRILAWLEMNEGKLCLFAEREKCGDGTVFLEKERGRANGFSPRKVHVRVCAENCVPCDRIRGTQLGMDVLLGRAS